MTIFITELKLNLKNAIIWAASLSLAMCLFLPVFTSMMKDPSSYEMMGSLANLSGSLYFEALGIDLNSMQTALGAYSYIHSILLVAAAVYGGQLGISLLSKECISGSSDFLFTKPFSRLHILLSKGLAAFCLCIFVSLIYVGCSFTAMHFLAWESYDTKAFMLVAFSALWIMLLYCSFGFLLSSCYAKIHSPSLAALGIAFITFIFGSFARITKNEVLNWLSPYNYFESQTILENVKYDTLHFSVLLVLCMLFISFAVFIFKQKDISNAR